MMIELAQCRGFSEPEPGASSKISGGIKNPGYTRRVEIKIRACLIWGTRTGKSRTLKWKMKIDDFTGQQRQGPTLNGKEMDNGYG